jgi:hypothetical protein
VPGRGGESTPLAIAWQGLQLLKSSSPAALASQHVSDSIAPNRRRRWYAHPRRTAWHAHACRRHPDLRALRRPSTAQRSSRGPFDRGVGRSAAIGGLASSRLALRSLAPRSSSPPTPNHHGCPGSTSGSGDVRTGSAWAARACSSTGHRGGFACGKCCSTGSRSCSGATVGCSTSRPRTSRSRRASGRATTPGWPRAATSWTCRVVCNPGRGRVRRDQPGRHIGIADGRGVVYNFAVSFLFFFHCYCILGYTLNRLFGRPIIGMAPAFRYTHWDAG